MRRAGGATRLAGVLLMGAALLLASSVESFVLQQKPPARACPLLPPPPTTTTPHHSSRRSGSSSTVLFSFWQGLQELFNPGAATATGISSQGKGGGPGLTPEEEVAKRRRHFRTFEPEEDVGSVAPYVLGGASLPSMDDLWREAWPTAACTDTMQRREDMNNGVGLPQPDALVRSFGYNDSILTVLYRDSSCWCPYSASVVMALEELKLPYKVKRVNLLAYGEKPDWVYRISSTGLLPVLEVDGRIIRESNDICTFANYFANSRFPGQARPMWPDKDDPLLPVAERLLELERDLFRDFFIYVFEGPEPRGKEEFLATLKAVDAALGAYPDGPWFLPGAEPSVVDCVFAPKVERVVAACLYWKGLDLRDAAAALPNLRRWLDALDARPAFAAAVRSDLYTLVTALEPLFGRAYAVHTPEAVALRARIDGVAPGAWRLPISPEAVALEPAPSGAGAFPSDEYARQAAAVRLIINHKRLPTYMLRALGRPGPEFRSVLADPFNEPDTATAPAMDAAYRYLVLALLRGHEAVEPLLRMDLRATDAAYQAKEGGKDPALGRARVVACLEYLRERISVPRDMTLAEARQLRAHLNWLADELR